MDELATEPLAQHCAVCERPLREGASFCSSCGQTPAAAFAAASAAAAAAAAAEEGAVAQELPLPPSGALIEQRLAAQLGELRRVGALFGMLLATSFAVGLVARVDRSPVLDAVATGIDAAIVLVFVLSRPRELLPLLRPPELDRRGALVLLGLSLAFVVVLQGYFEAIERLGVPLLSYTETYLDAKWSIASMLLILSVCPAVFEELAFRGVIQSSLERVTSAREACLIQAALFSVLHLLPIIFPSHFLMGLCFGYMRLRSKSLYPGMALHASWNALIVLQELIDAGVVH